MHMPNFRQIVFNAFARAGTTGFTQPKGFVGLHRASKNKPAQDKRRNAKIKAYKRAKRLGHS